MLERRRALILFIYDNPQSKSSLWCHRLPQLRGSGCSYLRVTTSSTTRALPGLRALPLFCGASGADAVRVPDVGSGLCECFLVSQVWEKLKEEPAAVAGLHVS